MLKCINTSNSLSGQTPSQNNFLSHPIYSYYWAPTDGKGFLVCTYKPRMLIIISSCQEVTLALNPRIVCQDAKLLRNVDGLSGSLGRLVLQDILDFEKGAEQA